MIKRRVIPDLGWRTCPFFARQKVVSLTSVVVQRSLFARSPKFARLTGSGAISQTIRHSDVVRFALNLAVIDNVMMVAALLA